MFKSNYSFVNNSDGCWPDDDDDDIVDGNVSGQEDPTDDQFLDKLFSDLNNLGDQKDERWGQSHQIYFELFSVGRVCTYLPVKVGFLLICQLMVFHFLFTPFIIMHSVKKLSQWWRM